MEIVKTNKETWIVIYITLRSLTDDPEGECQTFNNFKVCHSLAYAKKVYKALENAPATEKGVVVTASICAVADSWDYDTHPLLKGVK
jgi:hypothetical protein